MISYGRFNEVGGHVSLGVSTEKLYGVEIHPVRM